jgi:hypothetical protein
MTEPPQHYYSPEDRPTRGRGRKLAVTGIVFGAVSFLVILILLGPLGVLLSILGLARGERRPGAVAIRGERTGPGRGLRSQLSRALPGRRLVSAFRC